MLRWFLLPLLVVTLHAQEYKGKTLVRPSLIANATAAVPGKPLEVGLLLEMAPKAHTYWQYGGDAGFPTTLTWTLPPGFSAGPIQWPLPRREREPGDIEVYAYSDKVLLLTTIQVPADLTEKSVTLKAVADWLVCEEVCIPGSADLEITLPVAAESAPAQEELFAAFRRLVPHTTPPPFGLHWKFRSTETLLTISGLQGATAVDVFPLPADGQVIGHPTSTPIVNGEATVTIPAAAPLRGVLVVETAQGREGWHVEAPQTSPGQTPESQIEKSRPTTDAGTPGRRTTPLWLALLSGLLGGLILNIMPCVLPVISLKIFGFVRQAGNDPRLVFRHGLAFCGGIFLFFLGLGGVVAAINAQGGSASWGSQFQNPWFNVGMCSVIFLFALNLFGVFEIVLPGKAANAMENAGSQEGYAGSFFQGVFSTLLATSCSAPFLGAALGFTIGQPAVVTLLIFAAIAGGMSAPYLLLSAKPGWMKILPKPGMWMERVKQFMGFPLLAAMIWLLGVVGSQKGTDGMLWLGAFLLCLALAAWIYGAFCGPLTKPGRRTLALLFVVLIPIAGGFTFLGKKFASSAPGPRQAEAGGIPWVDFSAKALEELRAQGKPVFLDFTADWCLNCKYYEKTAIDVPAVREAFKKFGIVPMRADWTAPNPEIKAALKSFGRNAVPFYVLYPAHGAEPLVLGDFLTQQILLDAFAQAR